MRTIYKTTESTEGNKLQEPIGAIATEYIPIVLRALRFECLWQGDKAPKFHAE